MKKKTKTDWSIRRSAMQKVDNYLRSQELNQKARRSRGQKKDAGKENV